MQATIDCSGFFFVRQANQTAAGVFDLEFRRQFNIHHGQATFSARSPIKFDRQSLP